MHKYFWWQLIIIFLNLYCDRFPNDDDVCAVPTETASNAIEHLPEDINAWKDFLKNINAPDALDRYLEDIDAAGSLEHLFEDNEVPGAMDHLFEGKGIPGAMEHLSEDIKAPDAVKQLSTDINAYDFNNIHSLNPQDL
jgi:hypothetical protein